MTAKKFFTEEEKARIEATVRETEDRTSGEVVPLVVDESYDYPQAEMVGAGFFALATGILVSWGFGGSSVWIFLPVFLLTYLPYKLLIRSVPSLRRRLIPEAEKAAEVEEKAMISFLENGLHHTRDETGVLILISLLEHRVHVLADRGINAALPPDTWDEVVRTVTEGIRKGETCDALCSAIRHCGDLLEEKFPRRHDDTNELPNLILE